MNLKGGRIWLSGLLLVIIVLVYVAFTNPEAPRIAPVQVSVMQIQKRDVPIFSELVGQTIGSLDIAIRARVEGTLEGMHFEEGRYVKAGDLLYTIDDRPFRAKLVEAESKLAEANTRLAKAESDLGRVEPLARMNAVSKRDLDAAIAQHGAAKASVEAAKAALEFANIELGYTKIHAPNDGIIGISKARVGDFVGRNPNPVVLNTVSQIDPINVRISVSEQEYLKVARDLVEQGEKREKRGKKALKLILSDGLFHSYEGSVKALDSSVNPQTGTITVEASFPNPENIVRPGQFARVRAVAEVRKDALLVPQRAVQELQGTFSIFVIDDGSTAALRTVKLGPKSESFYIVDEGLTGDELVVVEGLQRLRPGASVIIAKD